MFSGGTLAESPRPFPLHQRHPSDHFSSYSVAQRPHAEPPRPLEPRPATATQPTYSENPNAPRSHETYRGPTGPQTSFRQPPLPQAPASGQSLPRLQDILTSSHAPASNPPETRGNWSATTATPTGPPPAVQHAHGPYRDQRWHPPMMLPPHQEGPPSSHGHAGSRDLPILETNPIPRQSAQPMSASPYSGYPDNARDYMDPRHERPAQAAPSYFSNAPHGPYVGPAHPEGQHTSPTLIDRSGAGAAPLETTQKTFLGTEDIPGQGRFYVYEGGLRIPATVDGEQVNPAWGLTKANKPRKRLAQACLDCREKKIKCEPGQSSACLQCEKAKRQCRRYVPFIVK